jgi:hypothetical protein
MGSGVAPLLTGLPVLYLVAAEAIRDVLIGVAETLPGARQLSGEPPRRRSDPPDDAEPSEPSEPSGPSGPA